MRTTFHFYFPSRPGLLLVAALNAAGPLAAASMPSPVTQAWAVRIDSPLNTSFEAGGVSVGPSGDVFLAGAVRHVGYNYDIVISRRHPSNGALVWEQRYEPADGASENERAFGMVAHGTNVYVVGSTVSTTGNEGPDFLTLKYRDTGELEWAARLDGPGLFNDSASEVAVDGQGNVLVLGGSMGTNGSPNILVVKYGPTGNLLWTYSYDGPGASSDHLAGMKLDNAGNIHIAGTSTRSGEEYFVFTLKLGANGQELWIAREESPHLYGVNARGMDVDDAGNVVTVGIERSYCVTWKYDSNGNRQWVVRYRAEEAASMQATVVRFDGSGNIITAANLYGAGINDAVLVKYAADGQQLWATRIAHPNGAGHLNALDVDGDGNSYLNVSPASDVVTVKVSPDGAQLWTVTYSSQGFFSDYGEFLEVNDSGDIFVAGRSTQFFESFFSLVKYTQQAVAGFATAVVAPSLQVVDPGADVVFTAETMGPEPIHFQWRMNGRVIPDATNATLALSNVQTSHRGDYSVVVSNPAGATVSPEARLSVRTPPEVVIAPDNQTTYLGTDAAFIATVLGNDFVTLQWRHNGTNIPGATNEFFRIIHTSAANGGLYDFVASTFGGTTTSSAAGLRISRAIELVRATAHRGSLGSWEYAPQFKVLPNGESWIAARSNHLEGSSIALHKHAADGTRVSSTAFESSGFSNAEPAHLALDGAGNVYITGLSRQPYITAALAVLKFSPEGTLLWSRILEGTNIWGNVHSLVVDANGNSTIGIRGSQGTTVIRYNSAGDVQWSHDDLSPDIETLAVAVDSAGNTYVGTSLRVGNDSEIRLRKLDATGATVWTRPYAEGMYNRLGGIVVDSSGNLIVAGTGELAAVPDSWMFVLKYSPDGQKLWETRTGSSWSEISYIPAVAVGPGDEITVMTMSDDDYILEQSGLTRIGPDGNMRYRIAEPQVLVNSPSQLALDGFGNAYITGYGGRAGTGADAVTAKYDAYGNRPWLVYHGGPYRNWESGLALGADAAGDIRVLATGGAGSDSSADFSLLHYRQRDPASTFRLQLIPDAAGTFHLSSPSAESIQIEASTDLQNWSALEAGETAQLLQPGGTAFSSSPQRFFRLILAE